MTSIIEIDGGLVKVIERSILSSVTLEEFLPRIERRLPVTLPVLPSNTRAVHWDPSDVTHQKLMLLVETAPHIAHINFRGTISELSLPWTRFMFHASTSNPANTMSWRFEDYRIFWARTSYNTPDAVDMIPALLPNVYTDGRICFGTTGASANQTLADRINQTVNEFYISEFNHDLTIRHPNGWRSWGPWKTMTRRDPTGWMNWPDLENGRHSWDSLIQMFVTGETNRLDAVIAPDGIPPLPIGSTFGRIEEWLDSISQNQRARLRAHIEQSAIDRPERFVMTPDDTTPFDPNVEEDEDEDEADPDDI